MPHVAVNVLKMIRRIVRLCLRSSSLYFTVFMLMDFYFVGLRLLFFVWFQSYFLTVKYSICDADHGDREV
jgi:hypothetical protein